MCDCSGRVARLEAELEALKQRYNALEQELKGQGWEW